MKKEVLIAVLSGLALGLIITFGIYTANRALELQKAKQAEKTEIQPTPPPNSTADKELTITSPEPNDLFNQSEITLSGIAWPEAIIAVITEKGEQLLQADDEGIFSVKLNLVKGFNEITVLANDEINETKSQSLIVTYSTTEIEEWKK